MQKLNKNVFSLVVLTIVSVCEKVGSEWWCSKNQYGQSQHLEINIKVDKW